MNTVAVNGPFWSTAAGGGAGLPIETQALGEHLQRCRGSAGRGMGWRDGAQAVHAFVLARFMTTTLALLALFAGLAWLVQ